MPDITTIGEVLIDLTQTGYSEQGVPLFAAYPGGAPANVAVAAAYLAAAAGSDITREHIAQAIRDACDGQRAVCVSLVREKKTEKPPKLYDLTTLQREANRVFGYTAKQTLDYAQSLYEKKLLTYPRTDSRYLTVDMAETASVVLHLAAQVPPFDACPDFFPDVAALVNDGKVSDHHAIIPTLELEKADLSELTVGERNTLLLVCRELLCAAAEPYAYEAVTAAFDCGGHTFTAKGRRILSEGWREIDHIFRASLKEQPEGEAEPAALPDFTEGQLFDQVEALHRPAQGVHGGHPPGGDGDCRERGDAGGRRAQGPGHPGHQGGDPGEAGGGRVCGAQREKSHPYQGGDQPGHRPAGYFDLSHAHGGVGAEADRHRQG